jgi:hypothetical protein
MSNSIHNHPTYPGVPLHIRNEWNTGWFKVFTDRAHARRQNDEEIFSREDFTRYTNLAYILYRLKVEVKYGNT